MTIAIPADLKAELDALTPSSAVSIVDEPTDISQVTVDDSVIDVSEIEDPLDAEYLQKVGHEILLVDAKADFVIKKVVNEIKARASLTKGKFIHEIQVRFGSLDESVPSKPGLMRYWASLGFWSSKWTEYGLIQPDRHQNIENAYRWARAYRSTLEFQEMFTGLIEDPTAILAASDNVLHKLQQLPQSTRIDVMAEIAEGVVPSTSDIEGMIKSPEVQKTLAQEALDKARSKRAAAEAQFSAIKANPDIKAGSPEYQKAAVELNRQEKLEAKHTQRITQLEEELTLIKAERIKEAKALEEAQKKEAAAKAAEAEAYAELEALQTDDDATRRRRIAGLSQSLTASIPDVLSDLQKYFAEREYYEISTRESIEDAARALSVFLSMKLSTDEPDATPKRKASSSKSSNRNSSQQPEDSGASA